MVKIKLKQSELYCNIQLLLLDYFVFSSKYYSFIPNERGENQSNVVDLKNNKDLM